MSDTAPNRTSLDVIRHALQPYPDSVCEQESCVAELLQQRRGNTLILTGHPPVYTLGTSAREDDILTRKIDGEFIDLYPTGRGGEVTYHGPGQLVCYLIVDISGEQDLRRHVWRLEEMVIRTLADFGVAAGRSERGIGVWVGERKIAAVGVRCRKWITYHGIALNINPNMKHFEGIITCGMSDRPVTSLAALGVNLSRADVEAAIIRHAEKLFGT
ncbi:MAG: lipoyl(octanoyl) transferase LipB [Mariprofundaceae bacterium]|nr:lipoyl(octanoyl) transferase LipB [Mariprofundaceae bacterium]